MDNQQVKTPEWNLIYEGKNISERISPYTLSIRYTDNLEGEADDIEIVIEDKDHRWKNSWLPQKGDKLTLSLGYKGETLLNAGSFQVDEIEFNGPPDTVAIRALAAGVKPELRTSRSAAYESMTLRNIAEKVAAWHGLTITGSVPEINVGRATQNHETDLGFLRRVALRWGYIFSVRGTQLVWHDQDALDTADIITTVTRKGLAGRYTLRSKTDRVYRACKVTYWNAKLKKDVSHTFNGEGLSSGDVLHLVQRAESKSQAERMARAALRRANGRQTEGSLTLFGNTRLVAGANITLAGWGQLDGDYQAVKSCHSIERGSGYTTTVDFSMSGAYGMKNLRNEKKLVKS